jgi:hypothetical protein
MVLQEQYDHIEKSLLHSYGALRRNRFFKWTGFSIGAVSTIGMTISMVLGQHAFNTYNSAQFSEDAAQLRSDVEMYRRISLLTAGAALFGFTVWEAATLQEQKPRMLLKQLRQIEGEIDRLEKSAILNVTIEN